MNYSSFSVFVPLHHLHTIVHVSMHTRTIHNVQTILHFCIQYSKFLLKEEFFKHSHYDIRHACYPCFLLSLMPKYFFKVHFLICMNTTSHNYLHSCTYVHNTTITVACLLNATSSHFFPKERSAGQS